MATLTFDTVERIAAEFHRAEAARHTPYATARRAVFSLVSALADLTDSEYAEIQRIVESELAVAALRCSCSLSSGCCEALADDDN